MTKSHSNRLTEKVEELWQFSSGLARSISLFHWLGYGLLILASFDLLEVFFPPRFMDPVWEFQTLGSLVERVPVPLLGLVLVFCGEPNLRSKWERPILKFLSWAALLAGILFLLLIPLGIMDTGRLDQQNSEQIIADFNQQMFQIQQAKKQLETATTTQQVIEQLEQAATEQEMEELLTSLERFKESSESDNTQQLEEVKTQLFTLISIAENTLTDQVKIDQSNQRLILFKNSVKWNLGALVSGILFIGIWQATSWAR